MAERDREREGVTAQVLGPQEGTSQVQEETSTQSSEKEGNGDFCALPRSPRASKITEGEVQESRVSRGLAEGHVLQAFPGLCPLPVRPKGQVRQLRKSSHCEVSEALLR